MARRTVGVVFWYLLAGLCFGCAGSTGVYEVCDASEVNCLECTLHQHNAEGQDIPEGITQSIRLKEVE